MDYFCLLPVNFYSQFYWVCFYDFMILYNIIKYTTIYKENLFNLYHKSMWFFIIININNHI